MLLSMTGHGQALIENGGNVVTVEVRTVNNRYLKITQRLPEGMFSLEPQVEGLIRKSIRRGTVNVQIRCTRQDPSEDARLNLDVLRSYMAQLEELGPTQDWGPLLQLPGVVTERLDDEKDLTQTIVAAVEEALDNLHEMRVREGAAMADDLRGNAAEIDTHLAQIIERAPLVVKNYQQRLTERINGYLEQVEVQLEPSDLIREIGVFSEKCDISEEITRLQSHLKQFEEILSQEQSQGKKLDFLVQEMFRETNTIGSKANDARIAQEVIEIKTSIERLREMIQNVE